MTLAIIMEAKLPTNTPEPASCSIDELSYPISLSTTGRTQCGGAQGYGVRQLVYRTVGDFWRIGGQLRFHDDCQCHGSNGNRHTGGRRQCLNRLWRNNGLLLPRHLIQKPPSVNNRCTLSLSTINLWLSQLHHLYQRWFLHKTDL